MVNKITKKRLKNVLVYDGLKIIILSVIVCLIVVLIFNGLAKKPSDGQDFKLIIDEELHVGEEELDSFMNQLFEVGPENGGFSYDTLRGEIITLRSNDESPKNYMLNNIYVDISQDDACVLVEDIYVQYLSENNAVDIVKYVDSALQFLFKEGLCDENGVFNENKVNAYFERTRGSDSRFKTNSQIESGKAKELKRLKAIYSNAKALKNCFELHPELLDERTFNYGGVEFTGKYAILIDKFDGNNGRYAETLFKRSYEDDSGLTVYTTEGIYITIGNNLDANGDLFYENLAFLYTLINRYSTFLTV